LKLVSKISEDYNKIFTVSRKPSSYFGERGVEIQLWRNLIRAGLVSDETLSNRRKVLSTTTPRRHYFLFLLSFVTPFFSAHHISLYVKAYCAVNAKFAERTLDALRKVLYQLDQEGKNNEVPIVWIHDYQLLTAATLIRHVSIDYDTGHYNTYICTYYVLIQQTCEEEGLRCRLGFFLHIPFPAWDLMRLFPWDDQILQGMLGNYRSSYVHFI
jgi:trehalose-6-phosphate synthase